MQAFLLQRWTRWGISCGTPDSGVESTTAFSRTGSTWPTWSRKRGKAETGRRMSRLPRRRSRRCSLKRRSAWKTTYNPRYTPCSGVIALFPCSKPVFGGLVTGLAAEPRPWRRRRSSGWSHTRWRRTRWSAASGSCRRWCPRSRWPGTYTSYIPTCRAWLLYGSPMTPHFVHTKPSGYRHRWS